MAHNFEEIKNEYSTKFREHGVSSASMLMPKGRHEVRFTIVSDYLPKKESPTILDYGCGLGFLHTYLVQEGIEHQYLGIDIVPEFIESCNKRVSSNAQFRLIQPETEIFENFDLVYASGVFNLQTAESKKDSLAYVRERILKLFEITTKVMIIDFLSPDVDFEQESAQHIDYRMVLDWLVPTFSRRWILRHDYLPYEYSLVIFKNDQISRPDNVFSDLDDRHH
jgi:SAM-dependent methyltransferase